MKKIQSYFFNLSKLQNQINQFTCDAIKILPKLKDKYDLIFLDADKKNYSNYFHAANKLLKSGGVLLVDNCIWSEKILDENPDEQTQAIKDFNELLAKSDDFESTLLTLQDGLCIGIKH